MWNSLLSRVVEVSSVECFKRRLDVLLSSELLDTVLSACNRFVFFLFISCVHTVRMSKFGPQVSASGFVQVVFSRTL